MHVIVTGASRGIGRALAVELAGRASIHAVARDAKALAELAAEHPSVSTYEVDLSSRADAARAGRELAAALTDPAVLVHNAGVWPASRELVGGLERAFAVNCAGGLELQRPLLEAGRIARVLVVSAGLLVKGRFDPLRTPTGEDFSWFRTYASTKLAFAAAMREVARLRPEIDVAVVHPGVVRTDLGARRGALGWLVGRVKRRWEDPETCARRLAAYFDRERWSPPGDARWYFESEEQPWPDVVAGSTPAVLAALAALTPPLLTPEEHVEPSPEPVPVRPAGLGELA